MSFLWFQKLHVLEIVFLHMQNRTTFVRMSGYNGLSICFCSSGELAAEFENRRKEMLQLESEVQQKMEKRKVGVHKHSQFLFRGLRISALQLLAAI